VTPERRAFLVKRRARDLGFTGVGVTDLSPPPHGKALEAWLDAGMAASMTYMHRQRTRRLHPETILPGATRAVLLSRPYGTPEPPDDPSAVEGFTAAGRIARYAQGRDYHDVLTPALQQLSELIISLGVPGTVARGYVDAGPVPERELAQRAGLGWIGKNTMLIRPTEGSYCFLASILTNLDLAVDPPFEADRCGSCRRCIDACPTDALIAERVLDSRRCISYLTIEHRGLIDDDLAALMGEWVFGCDVCQEVCPWNEKFAGGTPPWEGYDAEFGVLDLADLESISDDEFDRRFASTPFTRAGAAGMRRNAAIASRNRASATP
jgi:epoxyqueuosine reductase